MPGSKRASDAANGGGKRSKAAYVPHKYAGGRVTQLGLGMRGLLITCDVHMEKAAIGEAFRLLEELIEVDEQLGSAGATHPTPLDSAVGDGAPAAPATAGDSLAAELAALQKKETSGAASSGNADGASRKRRYSIAQTGCPGSVFIRLEDSSLDPLCLADRAMEQALASGRPGARHVVRMMPVQTCVSVRAPDGFAEAVKPLAQATLCGFRGTYAVHWRRRNNTSLDKMSIIDAVAAEVMAVAPEATVDLRNSTAAVSVEVIQTTGLVSVLPRWKEFLQYNLRTCAAQRDPDPVHR